MELNCTLFHVANLFRQYWRFVQTALINRNSQILQTNVIEALKSLLVKLDRLPVQSSSCISVHLQYCAETFYVQCTYVVFSRKNQTLIIKSDQIIVRDRVMAHFKATVILYLNNKASLLLKVKTGGGHQSDSAVS